MRPSAFVSSIDFISYSYSDDGISALQAWLARTIQKLENHLLGVCQTFSEENYLTVSILFVLLDWLIMFFANLLELRFKYKLQVIDAFALMGDIGGMAEKMQSFFLQEVLAQTHTVLKEMLEEVWI